MAKAARYFVLAFYQFSKLDNPRDEVAQHLAFFENRDITSRIYISEQGINGQMCAPQEDAEDYMKWMHAKPLFAPIDFKIHHWHEQVFPRKTVKYRPQLVATEREVNLSAAGEHVSPQKWKEMLEQNDGHLLLDVRNAYEWQVGHFKGAELPPCETFREFESYAENFTTTHDPKTTPVMMYCTGGIRCELYSSILKEKGFEKVYQLTGGIIGYGLRQGNDHWLGKLFVFDDRLSVTISEKEAPVIGQCHQCKIPIETYYNCANMDCNVLFLSCKQCLETLSGCCQESCTQTPRLRPYSHQNPHKPFRRWHQYFKEKPEKS